MSPIRHEPENFYTDALVTITSTGLTRLSDTIPISAISYFAIRRPMSYLALIFILGGVVVLACGWVGTQYYQPQDPEYPSSAFNIWDVALLGAILLFGLGVLAHFLRPYVLTVAAHSGNRIEIWHRSPRYVRTIRAALEIANTSRH